MDAQVTAGRCEIERRSVLSPDSRIVVATSFPPRLNRSNVGTAVADYDRCCVKSWIACGFRVLGINAADDIPPLAARHPEVEFVATTRDGRRSFGRSVPFITDILAILAGTGAPVIGILNSDLLFHPSDGWARIAATVQGGAVVAGRRYDLCTLNGGALYPYIPGFDYFFFSRAAAAELASPSQSFAMGIPWWDYWLPLSLAYRGHALRSFARPLVLHLMHGERAGQPHTEVWRMLAFELAQQLAGIADRQHVPRGWENLVALCRKMVSHTHDSPQGPEIDHTIAALIPACVQLISAAPGDGGDDTGARDRDHDVPPEWFASIGDRITAGRFMREADAAARRGAPSQAGTLYERAIACAPRDAGLLSMYGNFLQSRGDLNGAAHWFGRAAHLAPDSGYILNGFGTLLLQLGRPREAAGWLEKAVAAEPLNGSAWFNLATALSGESRHGEAIVRLEQQIAAHPEFADGPVWLDRIRRQF